MWARSSILLEEAVADIDAWSLKVARSIVDKEIAGPGVRVWLFGSRARGNAKPFSDIDIAVEHDGRLSRTRFAELRASLDESLIPFFVDVVDLAEAEPRLVEAVREEGILWSDG